MRALVHKDGLKAAAFAAVAGLVFFAFNPLGEGLRNLSYELPFLFRARIEVTNAVIVLMDEGSHRSLEQPANEDWDRSIHADLIERLLRYGARAIVFDIWFETPGDPERDASLVRAVAQHGRVVVAATVQAQASQQGTVIREVRPPFPALEKVAAWGVVETSYAVDPSVRRHYLGAAEEPSLAWKTAEVTMTHPPPRHPATSRWVNYYGPPFWLPHYSYKSVLSNELADADLVFSNQVVFVGSDFGMGNTAGRSTDFFRTPFTLWTQNLAPGVEVNATTYLNLWRGDWLTELPLWAELGLLLLGGAVLGYGLARLRPMTAVWAGIGVAIAVGAAATVWVWQTRIWTPWMIMVAVQVPCAVGWAVMSYDRKLRLEKEDLERRLGQARPQPAALYPEDPPRPTPALPRSARLYAPAPPVVPTALRGADGSTDPTMEMAAPDAPAVPDHEMLRCIGEGAYGQVWLARDVIGSYHAVKVVYRNSFRSAAPFEREFRGIQKFTPISRSHPGFVNILHVGLNHDAGYFYCIMEVGDDELTGQRIVPDRYSPKNLARELSQQGKLPVETCLQLGLDLAAALEHLHQQKLIHRDIKPSNIIFVHGVPKFADIGLVTDIAGTGRDVTYLGTEGYMAPEGPGSPASDVYSLGKVLYEASTGLDRHRFPELPSKLFAAGEPAELFQLNKIVLKACEKDPDQRYPSAAAMHQELLELKTRGAPKRTPWWRNWFAGRGRRLSQTADQAGGSKR